MANICDTQYKVMGERKAVADLWNTLQTMEVNTKNVYLYKLAEHYGIDYEKMGIPVRGHVYWAEFEADDDICLLSFDTESAWSACEEFFDELNKVLGGELSISYREIECGCDVFYVHDEQGFFPEECCVSSSGEPFEDACEDIFDTCQDAIAKWCEKMGISQGDRTDDEMVDFINSYEYENEDTYYYKQVHVWLMERFETIEKVPTWALCYIINGDPTGLSNEDIKMVDGFMQKWQVEIVSPLSQEGNASFSHYPAFGLPAEVEECKVIYHSENPQTL